MSRLLIITGVIGATAGVLVLGPDFAQTHSMAEQIALGLLAILMVCTLFGMKIGTILGFLFRILVMALIWRGVTGLLRVARLR
ncbi:hypothetical protein [Falsirhodobacter sp. 20TX0035]|uniref:hypothetical protein n=1 Tax=Falsirhodobacter sp. 20TX0035 TaxID=3022019 RepID=UPI00232B50B1|nr:hypothetical protein [Falsirhodobacter sp. 20TX0035]MDB6455215.1 hypothetical protein [Falsirhodobacter sp. 20TX0035]